MFLELGFLGSLDNGLNGPGLLLRWAFGFNCCRLLYIAFLMQVLCILRKTNLYK